MLLFQKGSQQAQIYLYGLILLQWEGFHLEGISTLFQKTLIFSVWTVHGLSVRVFS